ncbi:MAG: ribonuclease [Nitratireductor sp.]|nr:ribonuclease [Nitratireductor sp.]
MRLTVIAMLLGALLATGCSPADSASPQAYVLALSWQPAFCETAPRKRECRSQMPGRADARQFSLHGLWPQPGSRVYCGVDPSVIARDKSGRWRDIPMQRIETEIWNRLRVAMPGTQSALERHEWIKHGTCHADTPDRYFADSLALLDAINASSMRKLFETRIGSNVTGAEIRRAFEKDFGPGAGKRLRIACERDGNRQIIGEITIGLKGAITGNPDLGALIAAASETDPGCPGGIVDPAGLQ